LKILILGLGHVGSALARAWRAAGHSVLGTTTTPGKVEGLRELVDGVLVARGSEGAAIRVAAEGCDALVITVAPSVRNARSREERFATYRDALVTTCESASAAHPRCIFLSSFSVYGDGGPGEAAIVEDGPLSTSDEPSSVNYQLAEAAVLRRGEGAVLRLPDIYGAPGDTSLPDRVRLGLDLMGGRVPFGAGALFYRIHFEDVVRATDHVLTKGLRGAFNVCDEEALPPTNAETFNAISDANGWPRLQFLDQIKAPTRKISAARLYATGYRILHPGIGV
jgi:nucleoside-diphosphate-sugar epimerase